MRWFPLMFFATLGFAALGGGAHAQVKVIGGGLAGACALQALNGDRSAEAVKTCTSALNFEPLSRETTARTMVNRGVLYIRRRQFMEAERDFSDAQSLTPELPEIYVDRGVSLIRQNRWSEAVAQLDHGIDLSPYEPEKAYFDRALAREALGDLSGAYADFSKAAELKPDWPQPKNELKRYVVR